MTFKTPPRSLRLLTLHAMYVFQFAYKHMLAKTCCVLQSTGLRMVSYSWRDLQSDSRSMRKSQFDNLTTGTLHQTHKKAEYLQSIQTWYSRTTQVRLYQSHIKWINHLLPPLAFYSLPTNNCKTILRPMKQPFSIVNMKWWHWDIDYFLSANAAADKQTDTSDHYTFRVAYDSCEM